MKKFELFMYESRDYNTGNYIGRTRRYEVMAENDDDAMSKGYKENRWARGCWCSEIEEKEETIYGIEYQIYWEIDKSWHSGYVMTIKAKDRAQAKRGYDKVFKGKKCRHDGELGMVDKLSTEGYITYGNTTDIYTANFGIFKYDATND